MDEKILVAYASTHGSSEEIAKAVAAALREQGFSVDIEPARTVRALEGYQGVVLGAPLYMFHLHKDALRFLARHQAILRAGSLRVGGPTVAVFAGGPYGDANEKVWQDVRQNLEKELAKFPWLEPVATEVVGGRFDPQKLHFPWNLIPALKQSPPSDLRDWAAIHAWAASLAEKFIPAAAASGLK